MKKENSNEWTHRVSNDFKSLHRQLEWMERNTFLPAGKEERLRGYGIIGLNFQSGHMLGLRRFTASSFGPAYTTVWHRNPMGSWIIYSDIDPYQACGRYFGTAIHYSVKTPIHVSWSSPDTLLVSLPQEKLFWRISLEHTSSLTIFNGIIQLLPQGLWSNKLLLKMAQKWITRISGLGKFNLSGTVPNGQNFRLEPQYMLSIKSSHAEMNGIDFGPTVVTQKQVEMADFVIPQQGIFMLGEAVFDAFDPTKHSAETSIFPGSSATKKRDTVAYLLTEYFATEKEAIGNRRA